MGYTALLRWSNPPPSSSSAVEMVLQCVLDRYNIIPSTKSTVSLRTYRAALPDPRLLTVITFPSTIGLESTAFLLMDRKAAAPEAVDGHSRFQTMAVSPASSVVPLLNALSSPFVIGVAKSAKASAATTAEKPVASALMGQHLVLHSIALSVPSPPLLAVQLRVHVLAPPHTGLILEAEVPDGVPPAACDEFLEACLPCPGGRILRAEGDGWDGVERSRKVAELIGVCLREEGII